MADPATRAATKAVYAEFTTRYKDAPVDFAKNCLDLDPLEWQREVMLAVALGDRRLSAAAMESENRPAQRP